MRKNIKAVSLILSLLILAIFALIFLLNRPEHYDRELSPDQQKVADILGHPEQFVVSYLESGNEDNSQLVRNEVWLYSKNGTRVTFLGGEIVDSQEYTPDKEVTPSPYHPEDFVFGQSFNDVAGIVGKGSLNEVRDIPGITDDSVRVYTSEEVMFVIENGYLTYIQTFVSEGESK